MQPSPPDPSETREPSLVQLLASSTFELQATLERMDALDEPLGLVQSDGHLVHVNLAWRRVHGAANGDDALQVKCGAQLPADAPGWLAPTLGQMLWEVFEASAKVSRFELVHGPRSFRGDAARLVDSSGTYALLALRRAA